MKPHGPADLDCKRSDSRSGLSLLHRGQPSCHWSPCGLRLSSNQLTTPRINCRATSSSERGRERERGVGGGGRERERGREGERERRREGERLRWPATSSCERRARTGTSTHVFWRAETECPSLASFRQRLWSVSVIVSASFSYLGFRVFFSLGVFRLEKDPTP